MEIGFAKAFSPYVPAAFLEARSKEEVSEVAHQILAVYGLCGYTNSMEFSCGAARRTRHEFSSLSVGLQPHASNNAHDELDVVAKHIRTSCIPLAWSIDARIANGSFYDQLKSFGVQAGWSVGIRGENSFSNIEIYSNDDTSAFGDIHSDLLLFSHYLNEAMRTLWIRQHPQEPTPILTARERQCLQWSAGGKTSNEIGLILGISQNTVYFHLKKAASKFQVYGTRHAISRAMQMGLI